MQYIKKKIRNTHTHTHQQDTQQLNSTMYVQNAKQAQNKQSPLYKHTDPPPFPFHNVNKKGIQVGHRLQLIISPHLPPNGNNSLLTNP